MDIGRQDDREAVMSFETYKEFNVLWAIWHDKDREVMGEHTVKTELDLYPCNYFSSLP